LKCLLVGDSLKIKEQVGSIPAEESPFVYVGAVPYEEVAGYFAATDVGLYPVPGLPYDDGRSPIKVFEYLAAGRPVVAPPIRELKRLSFANVLFAEPSASSFAEGIVRAFESSWQPGDEISSFDWSQLSRTVEKVLFEVTKRNN